MKIPNKELNKNKKVFVSIIVVILVILISAFAVYKNLSGPVDVNEEKEAVVEIPRGSSLDEMAELLEDAELIKSKEVFKFNVKLSGKGAELKSGQYLFDQSYTNSEIIDDIVSGKNYFTGAKVTVKEGATSAEIIDILVSENMGNKAVYEKLVNSPSEFSDKFTFLKEGKITSLEGFLYPSTYFYNEDDTEKEVLEKMLYQFHNKYTEEYKEEINKSGKSFYDVIKMASIVEKEAVLDEDRPIIASVFYNRLEKNMALQSDATVQYAFKERKKVVSYADLKVDSPYNSYKYKGLPPTPIANPSIESIQAAIEPADTDYLYFVAKTDGGGNNYAKTYEEHLKNEKQYKKQREEQNKK